MGTFYEWKDITPGLDILQVSWIKEILDHSHENVPVELLLFCNHRDTSSH
jgi:hypothetical protein